jgi:hypothetical protein
MSKKNDLGKDKYFANRGVLRNKALLFDFREWLTNANSSAVLRFRQYSFLGCPFPRLLNTVLSNIW